MLYECEKNDKIICLLCRHYCQLKEGQIGVCGVNQNRDGKLKNLVYGKVAALNVDPIEKKPLYHFLPDSTSLSLGTVGCNFQCPFCQNWQISQTKETTSSYEISVDEIVNIALQKGCESISYTYNEPTIFYPFAKDIALKAKEHGIKSVFVSNGLETPEVIADMKGVIDAFNIDLKSFDKGYYKKVLKGSLDGVLDTLKRLKEGGFWLEITTLIVPEVNDSKEELEKIASFIADELDVFTPWHISAFHPDFKMQDGDGTKIEKLYEAKEIGKKAGLKYIYMGNVGAKSITYCPKCNHELIVRDGFRVLKDNLKDGRCLECKRELEGIWS
jgi:pyruvate formate lyase activating enzyme